MERRIGMYVCMDGWMDGCMDVCIERERERERMSSYGIEQTSGLVYSQSKLKFFKSFSASNSVGRQVEMYSVCSMQRGRKERKERKTSHTRSPRIELKKKRGGDNNYPDHAIFMVAGFAQEKG